MAPSDRAPGLPCGRLHEGNKAAWEVGGREGAWKCSKQEREMKERNEGNKEKEEKKMRKKR